MKNFITITGFLSIFIFTACAQTTYGLYKSYAFFKESHPGTVMVDDKGNMIKPSIDTVRIIYIETKGRKMPQIDSMLYNGQVFTASLFRVENLPVEVGSKREDEQKIFIKPRKGNSLWQLELTLFGKQKSQATNNKIILKGQKEGRRFTWIIDHEVELQPDLRG